jgi:hypothetical protein
VGRMIKNILWYFGYVPCSSHLEKATYLRDFSSSKLFHTSAVYEKKGTAKNSLQFTII